MRNRLRSSLALVAFLVSLASAQDAQTLSERASDAFARREYAKSAALYDEALKKDPRRVHDWYGASCAYALVGQKDQAFRCLGQLAGQGFDSVERLRREESFARLRSDARWGEIEARVAANYRSGGTHFWDGWALRTPYKENLSEDEKVAGLSKVWSEVKLNFAHFDLVPDVNWDQLYLDALPRVRRTRSTLEYANVLREMTAKLRDGNTGIVLPPQLSAQLARPAIRTKLLDRHVAIVGASEAAKRRGALVGSEILEIDGMPVRRYAETRVMPYMSATPSALDARLYGAELLQGPLSKEVRLTLMDLSGRRTKVSLPRVSVAEWEKEIAPPAYEFRMLPGNVAYVALNSFEGSAKVEERFSADFERIARADGLVLDMRENAGGNQMAGYVILAFLTDQRPIPMYSYGVIEYSPNDRFAVARGLSGNTSTMGTNDARRFGKPVTVLVGGDTRRDAELFLVSFDAAKAGSIVGEPTAGTPFYTLNVNLPGGLQATISHFQITYPFGPRIDGVGVQPTRLVRPSLADFRAGKDTVLEAGLAEIRRQAK